MSDFWWECEEDDEGGPGGLPGRVFAYTSSLDSSQALLHALNEENARRYSCRDVMGLGGNARLGSIFIGGNVSAVTENIVASVIQTAVALIAATRPKPTFLTDGAEWAKQQQAKKLDKFMSGMYDRLKVYPLWVRAFRDACVFGTGCVKVITSKSGPIVEKVLIDDIIVDEQEARDCLPRQLHQRRYVDRGILAHLYPDCAEEIEKADSASVIVVAGGTRSSNMLEVMESWRLPSEEGAEDGRHCVCIQGVTLFDERYKKDYFPFVFYRWEEPITGFYGIGLAEPLTNLQLDLNAINSFIKACHRRIIKPDVYVDFDQRIPDAFYQNAFARVFRTRGGKPPVFYTPQALNAETYNERRYIFEQAFKLMGVSEMTSQAKKQPGITSGVAINAVADIQTGRFAIQSENFEDAHLQTAQRIEWAMKYMAEKDRMKVKVAFRAKKLVETIDWGAVDPKEDVFQVTIAASSLLPKSPAGRLQTINDWMQIGAIDKRQWRHLADLPDLEHATSLDDAGWRYAEYAIDHMRTKMELVHPVPEEDLLLCVKLTQLACLRDQMDGCPEELVALYQQRISLAKSLLNMASQPDPEAAPAPMAPGMPIDPAAMPMPGVVPGAPLAPPGSPLPPGV